MSLTRGIGFRSNCLVSKRYLVSPCTVKKYLIKITFDNRSGISEKSFIFPRLEKIKENYAPCYKRLFASSNEIYLLTTNLTVFIRIFNWKKRYFYCYPIRTRDQILFCLDPSVLFSQTFRFFEMVCLLPSGYLPSC